MIRRLVRSKKPGTSMRDFLKSFGIVTNQDLYAYLNQNARKGESNYQTMVRSFGEANADKIMRRIEVMEWF